MSVTAKVTRREKLARKILQLVPAAEQELAKAALTGAEEVIGLAKQYAHPAIKGSGRARLVTGRTGAAAAATGRTGAVAAEAAFTDNRAHWFEFGTQERFHESGKSTGRMPATPALFPAYRILKRRVTGRMSRAVSKAAKTVAKS